MGITLEDQRVEIVAQGLNDGSVAEALAVFAVAAQISPAPQMIPTSQVCYAAGANS